MCAGWAGREGWEQSHYPTGRISQGPRLTKLRVILDKFTISALVLIPLNSVSPAKWMATTKENRMLWSPTNNLCLIFSSLTSIIHQQVNSRARLDRDKGLVVWKTHWFYFSIQTDKQQKPLCLAQQKGYMYYQRKEDEWIKKGLLKISECDQINLDL